MDKIKIGDRLKNSALVLAVKDTTDKDIAVVLCWYEGHGFVTWKVRHDERAACYGNYWQDNLKAAVEDFGKRS